MPEFSSDRLEPAVRITALERHPGQREQGPRKPRRPPANPPKPEPADPATETPHQLDRMA